MRTTNVIALFEAARATVAKRKRATRAHGHFGTAAELSVQRSFDLAVSAEFHRLLKKAGIAVEGK